jgi:hypothetical protein
MEDTYPEVLELDVDRRALRAYLRTKWLFSWMAAMCFFGVMFGVLSVSDKIDGGSLESVGKIVSCLLGGIGRGLLVAVHIGIALYFLRSHWVAGRLAATLRVSVEGPFLRIVQNNGIAQDRKLHFRSIVDYSTVQGPLMKWLGVTALHMTTTAGGPQGGVQIVGLQDAIVARDMLAQIDSMREGACLT